MEMMQEEIYLELKKIENEIQNLKILIIKTRQMPKQIVSLKGMLKGITVTEEDIKEAKKSLFKFGA